MIDRLNLNLAPSTPISEQFEHEDRVAVYEYEKRIDGTQLGGAPVELTDIFTATVVTPRNPRPDQVYLLPDPTPPVEGNFKCGHPDFFGPVPQEDENPDAEYTVLRWHVVAPLPAETPLPRSIDIDLKKSHVRRAMHDLKLIY